MPKGKTIETVAVAMSGGVDSSAAAALLAAEGRPVFGITAVMTHEYSRCCSDEDVRRARAVAEQLGIPHHLVDVRAAFQQHVMEPFTAAYLAGRTPSPCVVCNRAVKFGALMHEARKRGADRMATGHYVRRCPLDGGGYGLYRGVDPSKDQSYFLARLSAAQVRSACFPLGDRIKSDIAALAADQGLACRRSRESQELCFVTEGTHGEWIDLRSFDTPGPGAIVDRNGTKLGEHRGIHHYTIGQRRGLGIATGAPVYVVAIDAAANRIVVGTRPDVLRESCRVGDITWIGDPPAAERMRLSVQIRYNHTAAAAEVAFTSAASAHVRFEEAQFAVTPGQLAAFYDGDRVLGGGWIA